MVRMAIRGAPWKARSRVVNGGTGVVSRANENPEASSDPLNWGLWEPESGTRAADYFGGPAGWFNLRITERCSSGAGSLRHPDSEA